MDAEAASRPAPDAPITDEHREHAVELLQRACGDGRMTLEEFSTRAGVAWAAETHEQLREVTAGLATPPPVGTTQTAERLSAVFGEHTQRGRWRVPRRMSVRSVFGSVKLDLREATIGADAVAEGVVDIHVRVVFGEAKLTVPEGVEVELLGKAAFGNRTMHLAPVPRRQGTPLLRVHAHVAFGELKVRSAPPASATTFTRWLDNLIREHI